VGFLGALFGRDGKVTWRRPLVIPDPVIGFLNLMGAEGTVLAEADSRALSPLFRSSLDSTYQAPRCDVLFLYCRVDQAGQLQGCDSTLPELITEAGALVIVVASGSDIDSLMSTVSGKGGWTGNLVLTTDRRGPKFIPFFARLFRRMFEGGSMLTAWTELAPQVPGRDDPEVPSTVMISRGPGHIAFGRRSVGA